MLEQKSDSIEFRFNDALQLTMEKFIAVFKSIRNKTLRVVIISNETSKSQPQFFQKILNIVNKIASKLNIIFDIICFKKDFTTDKSLKGLFQTIQQVTDGRLYEIETSEDFSSAFADITTQKEVLKDDYIKKKLYKEPQKFLEIIASELKQIESILGDADLKCQICFQKECACKGVIDFYTHGRKCPNCDKIMHLCCAGKWAENQNLKDNYIGYPTVFRCPFCFYLLKVPKAFVNFDDILAKLQEKWHEEEKKAETIRIEEEKKMDELESYSDKLKQSEFEKAEIFSWLKSILKDRKEREIERIAEEIVRLPTREEKISFINYLKFSNDIDDDSMPI